jgi:hypothetical protein
MSTPVKPDDRSLTPETLENFRVAYQAALALRTSRADETWSQFNAMAVVQSILVAAAVALSTTEGQNLAGVGIALLGCLISVVWLSMHLRGKFWIEHYLDCASKYEQQLEGVDTIALGKLRRPKAGPLTVTSGSKIVILSFAVAHVILLISALI